MSENIEKNLENKEILPAETCSITVNQADTSEDSISVPLELDKTFSSEPPESPAVSSTAPDINLPEDSTPKQVKSTKSNRELKSLLEAVKEANLDTNILHKRKSDHNVPTLPKTPKRRNSSSSNDSFQSGKRSTRSQNPEFVQKHKKFLKSVTGTHESEEEIEICFENNEDDEDWSESPRLSISGRKTPISRARSRTPFNNSVSKSPALVSKPVKRKSEIVESAGDGQGEDIKKTKKIPSPTAASLKKDKDKFCWRCHREGVNIQCETCPRSYHIKCLKIQITNTEHWPCPECVAIIKAESTKTRSPIFKNMTQEQLCELLKFAVKRMIGCQGSEPFIHPVDSKSFPDYRDYIIQPMDLTTLQNNIRDNNYGSTVAFLADAKWILHNSIIFNSHQSKLTTSAKAIIKICKQEMAEIETCAECYLNANTKKNTWFVEVCSKPHILLWAKLKGFPFWPAKGMKHDSNSIHVKFFGAHDRAWVPIKECFLYSKKDPNTTNKQKRSNIAECVKEVDVHIKKLVSRFGEFKHAPYRIPYNPAEEEKQLLMMLPSYDAKKASLNLTIKTVKGVKSATNSPEIKKKENDQVENENSLSSTSKSSLNSATSEKKDFDLNIMDFDKFVEGYGTEDEDEGDLNVELRSKIAGDYVTDSEEDTCSQSDSTDKKEFSDNEDIIKSLSSTDLSIIYKGKNVTKIKTLPEIIKRSNENSPEISKFRRESEDSFKSDSSKISKIELTSNVEFSIGSNIEAISANGEVQDAFNLGDNKTESMADKLIKKINKSMSDISKKVVPNEEKPESPEEKPDSELNDPKTDTTNEKNDSEKEKSDSLLEKEAPLEEEPIGNVSEDQIEKDSSEAEKLEISKEQSKDQIDSSNVEDEHDESLVIDESSSLDVTPEKAMPPLEPKSTILQKVLTNDLPEESSDDSISENESSESLEGSKQRPEPEIPSFIKVINVKDIVKEKSKALPSEKEYTDLEILHDQVEIKSEPVSDTEEMEETHPKPQYDVTLSIIEKNKKEPEKTQFKVVDNLTRVIDAVATNSLPKNNELTIINQKARKTFPTIKKPTQVYQVKLFNQEKNQSKIITVPIKTCISTATTPKNSITITKTTTTPKTVPALKENLVYITQNQNSMILPPNQPISIGNNVANPILAMVQHPNQTILIQNQPSTIQISNANSTTTETISSTTTSLDILSDDLCKTVGDLICKPPPKLKPKPPGPLSTYFDEGNPSSAGPVTKTINAVSHRMADYFCGLLKETLSDLVNVGNPDAKIKTLELEIENLKHKHTEEMLEFRKNISTILKDIQKSIVEERSKIIDETKIKCEEEKQRAIEEAKSKQWCAYCFKEAQFYCCWNTSYCDYPCQQKHWAMHMKTCSQSSVRNLPPATNGTNSTAKPQAPTTIFKAVQKFPPGTKIVKTSRMIQVKPAVAPQKSPVFIQRPVQLQSANIGQSTLTLLESTPGNFEIVGNHEPISLNGKLIPATIGKVKTTTTTSTTVAQPKTYIISQKPVTVTVTKPTTTEITATTTTNTSIDK